MSEEEIPVCSICHVTFDFWLDLVDHKQTCVEIVEENIDIETISKKENIDVETISDKENVSDNIPKMKKSKKNITNKREINQIENNENFTGGAKNKWEGPKNLEPGTEINVETSEYQNEKQISALRWDFLIFRPMD